MAKEKTVFVCSACGCETRAGWASARLQRVEHFGGTGSRRLRSRPRPSRRTSSALASGASAMRLSEIPEETSARATTGIGELDRVLGGGVVEGLADAGRRRSGHRQSTRCKASGTFGAEWRARAVYFGEESVRQIKMRARRLGVTSDNLLILSENAMDAAERRWEEIAPDYMVIDSIQTMYRPDMASAPGSVSQVRECASLLMRMAKTTGCAVFLVGHVTKEGAIAGPRVLEHMVDVVLYIEGDRQHEYRILRAVKTASVRSMSLGFLRCARAAWCRWKIRRNCCFPRGRATPGSCVHCAIEGSRPMLVACRALVW